MYDTWMCLWREIMAEKIDQGNVSLPDYKQLYQLISQGTSKYSAEKICNMVDVLLRIITWSSPRYRLNFDNLVIHGMIGERVNHNNEIERFTYWPTTMSLRTYLRHPKKGWNDLQRGSLGKDFTNNQIKKLLTEDTNRAEGLRTHLGTGYRKKTSKEKHTKPKGDNSE